MLKCEGTHYCLLVKPNEQGFQICSSFLSISLLCPSLLSVSLSSSLCCALFWHFLVSQTDIEHLSLGILDIALVEMLGYWILGIGSFRILVIASGTK